ncbi:MAG: acyl-ACP thioesterase [Treponema sp.]|jgi:acyl-ACP thioesterase|nr:acyl-ACP thioesterase [Treponema sp.]
MDIFEEQRLIRFADIDQSDTITAAAVCDFFQEAAISHAELLGVGRNAMQKAGQVWILSRLSVFIERRSRYREQVMVRSWPRGSNRLFAVRDYDIRPPAGPTPGEPDVFVRGRSAWLILDMEKRRPLRPQAVAETLPPNEGINALPGPGGSNEAAPALESRDFSGPDARTFFRRAAYSDIDYNGHMNNTRYIQWIQDLMEPEILEEARQIRLDINYLSEVRRGENIALRILSLDSLAAAGFCPEQNPVPCKAAFAIEGLRETAGTEPVSVFRAELHTG